MQWPTRFRDGPALREALRREVEWHSINHPAGFYVRVHVLGDYDTVEYVAFWLGLLDEFPPLHIWGFTFRQGGTAIGDAIQRMIAAHEDRCRIRVSFGDGPAMCSRVFKRDEIPLGAGKIEHKGARYTVCPVERGLIKTCADCGICFSRTQTNVAFILR